MTGSGGSMRRGAALVVLGNLFPPAATLVMAPFLAHGLGVQARGELAAVTAPYLLAVAVATLGLPDALTQVLASGRRPGRRGWWTAVLLTVASGLVVVALSVAGAPLVVGPTDSALQALVVVAGAATVPALGVGLLRALAAGRQAWHLVAAERVTTGAVKIVATVVVASAGALDLRAATMVVVGAPVLGAVPYLLLLRTAGPGPAAAGAPRPRLDDPTPVAGRALLAFASRAWGGSVAGILLMRLDQLLVLPLSDATQLGYLAVAVNVSEVPLVLTGAVREVVFAADARRQDDERLTRAARTTVFVAVVVVTVLLATAALWLPVVFGSAFADALPVVVVAALAVLVGVPGSVAGSALAARGRPGLRSVAITAGCVANVTTLLLLVPPLGGLGAALATLVGNAVSGGGSLLSATRTFDLDVRDFVLVRRGDVRRILSLHALRRAPATAESARRWVR